MQGDEGNVSREVVDGIEIQRSSSLLHRSSFGSTNGEEDGGRETFIDHFFGSSEFWDSESDEEFVPPTNDEAEDSASDDVEDRNTIDVATTASNDAWLQKITESHSASGVGVERAEVGTIANRTRAKYKIQDFDWNKYEKELEEHDRDAWLPNAEDFTEEEKEYRRFLGSMMAGKAISDDDGDDDDDENFVPNEADSKSDNKAAKVQISKREIAELLAEPADDMTKWIMRKDALPRRVKSMRRKRAHRYLLPQDAVTNHSRRRKRMRLDDEGNLVNGGGGDSVMSNSTADDALFSAEQMVDLHEQLARLLQILIQIWIRAEEERESSPHLASPANVSSTCANLIRDLLRRRERAGADRERCMRLPTEPVTRQQRQRALGQREYMGFASRPVGAGIPSIFDFEGLRDIEASALLSRAPSFRSTGTASANGTSSSNIEGASSVSDKYSRTSEWLRSRVRTYHMSEWFDPDIAPRRCGQRNMKRQLYSRAEDELIVVGLRRYSRKDLESIRNKLLPHRTVKQIRHRVKNLSKKKAKENIIRKYIQAGCKPLRWTQADDDLLAEGVRRFGFRWEEISSEILPHRGKLRLRSRWMEVRKISERNMYDMEKQQKSAAASSLASRGRSTEVGGIEKTTADKHVVIAKAVAVEKLKRERPGVRFASSMETTCSQRQQQHSVAAASFDKEEWDSDWDKDEGEEQLGTTVRNTGLPRVLCNRIAAGDFERDSMSSSEEEEEEEDRTSVKRATKIRSAVDNSKIAATAVQMQIHGSALHAMPPDESSLQVIVDATSSVDPVSVPVERALRSANATSHGATSKKRHVEFKSESFGKDEDRRILITANRFGSTMDAWKSLAWTKNVGLEPIGKPPEALRDRFEELLRLMMVAPNPPFTKDEDRRILYAGRKYQLDTPMKTWCELAAARAGASPARMPIVLKARYEALYHKMRRHRSSERKGE